MVIEDEELLLEAIVTKLGILGIKVIHYKTGKEAIEHVKAGQSIPDALWLDYHLPDMTGLEVLTEIRENNSWNKVPVFIVSNSANDESVHTMLALGAKKYILKAEHRLEDIITEITNILVEKEN